MSSESESDDFLSADEGGSDTEVDLATEAKLNLKKDAKKSTKSQEEDNLSKKERINKNNKSTSKECPQSCSTVKKKQSKEFLSESAKDNTELDNKSQLLHDKLQSEKELPIQDENLQLQVDNLQSPVQEDNLQLQEDNLQLGDALQLQDDNLQLEGDALQLQHEKELIQQISENVEQLNIIDPLENSPQIAEEEISHAKDTTLQPLEQDTKDKLIPVPEKVDQEEEKCLQTKERAQFKPVLTKESDDDKIVSRVKEESKVKPMKESKIGMKKPRERLGERLGNKKLGSRITKPLVGISSDSLREKDKSENLKSQQTNNLQGEHKEHISLQHSNDQNLDDASGWASWGDWGSTLITAASVLTKEVSRGVGVVVETVESGIGAPDPMELAKELVEKEKMHKESMQSQEKQQQRETNKESVSAEEELKTNAEPNYGFGFGSFGSLVSGVSGALETASNKVLLGGLDTLEKIGRKTMDIIQDGDPGLRRKRRFLGKNKENLSMVLREARERAIAEEEERSQLGIGRNARPNQVSLAHIWDNSDGAVHMEALSLVAKQCRGKTSVLMKDFPPVYARGLHERIGKIKAFATIEEDTKVDDIPSTLSLITRDVQLPLQFKNMLTGWPSLQDSLNKLCIEICGLGAADLSAIQMEVYGGVTAYVSHVVGLCHKAAEMALITQDLEGGKLAQQFQRLCGCISGGLERSADDICESITKALPASDPQFNDTITNIYVQVAEANSYMETSLSFLNNVIVQAEAKLFARDL